MTNNFSPYNFAIELFPDISERIKLQPVVANVKKLITEGKYEELAELPVSTDCNGKVISCFRDMKWKMWPYITNMALAHKGTLDFTFLENSPQILLEVKIIFYVWLRIRSRRNPKKRIKVETLLSRYDQLKPVLIFLQENHYASVGALCEIHIWEKLETYLTQQKYGYGRLTHILGTINFLNWMGEYLPFSFQLPAFSINELSKKLAFGRRIDTNQTFAIPHRLADLLYGEALALVEFAWPNRDKIAELIQQRYDLYYEVKEEFDKLIDSDDPKKNKQTQRITKIDRDTCSKRYQEAIRKRLQRLQKANNDLLMPLIKHQLLKKNKIWPELILHNLLTACFICTHAFSGMRPSESYQLKPGCYATRIVSGQTFHVLQGATHKLTDGLKRDEWLCSPGAGKAVELAEALTSHYRKHLQAVADKYRNAGDIGQAKRLCKSADCLWLRRLSYFEMPHANLSLMNCDMKKFAARVGATVTEEDLHQFHLLNRNVALSYIPIVGQIWPYHAMQMRRTFAVFGGRYNLLGISATKQQFKHLKIRITEYYCSGTSEARAVDTRLDTELMEMIMESRVDEETTALHQLYNSDEKLAGGKGKAIMQDRRSEPHKYSSWDTVRQYVKQGKLTYHSTGITGCANGYNCEMGGVVNPAYCVECDGAIITITHAQNWQQRHSAAVKYIEQNLMISSNEYSHFFSIIRAAELVMTDHCMDFVPFVNDRELIDLWKS